MHTSQEQMDASLLCAVKKNKTREALVLLKQGATLSQLDTAYMSHGWNALHWACYHGNKTLVKAIIKNPTLLCLEKILTGKSFPVFKKSNKPRKIFNVVPNLFHSLFDWLPTLPKLEINDINKKSSPAYLRGFFRFNGQQTPLHIVTQKSNVEEKQKLAIIHYLLENGAEPDVRDTRGKRAIRPYFLVDEKNRVTIRIWHPVKDPITDSKTVGHVSLETAKHYISFWPGGQCGHVCSDNENSHFHSLYHDKLVEGGCQQYREPDTTLTLYSLDSASINQAYDNAMPPLFPHDKLHWSLLGSTFISYRQKNCVGVVSDLLFMGKIQRWASLTRKCLESAGLTFLCYFFVCDIVPNTHLFKILHILASSGIDKDHIEKQKNLLECNHPYFLKILTIMSTLRALQSMALKLILKKSDSNSAVFLLPICDTFIKSFLVKKEFKTIYLISSAINFIYINIFAEAIIWFFKTIGFQLFGYSSDDTFRITLFNRSTDYSDLVKAVKVVAQHNIHQEISSTLHSYVFDFFTFIFSGIKDEWGRFKKQLSNNNIMIKSLLNTDHQNELLKPFPAIIEYLPALLSNSVIQNTSYFSNIVCSPLAIEDWVKSIKKIEEDSSRLIYPSYGNRSYSAHNFTHLQETKDMYNSGNNEVTIIRMWHSHARGGQNVGHVSIDIPSKKAYFSLWPNQSGKPFKSYIAKHNSYDDDKLAEGRIEETAIYLYSLNTDAMCKAAKKFIANIKYWNMTGHNIFGREASSCSGLAYFILCAGGIWAVLQKQGILPNAMTPKELCQISSEIFLQNLLGGINLDRITNSFSNFYTKKSVKLNAKAVKSFIRENIVTTPDSLADLVIYAKQIEKEFYKIKNKSDLTFIHPKTKNPGILGNFITFFKGIGKLIVSLAIGYATNRLVKSRSPKNKSVTIIPLATTTSFCLYDPIINYTKSIFGYFTFKKEQKSERKSNKNNQIDYKSAFQQNLLFFSSIDSSMGHSDTLIYFDNSNKK